MAEICIIYARENEKTAERLYEHLSQQWTTWWDDKIVGRFAQAIERELSQTVCVVPLFSEQSRSRNTFTDELRIAERNHKHILPITLDNSEAPYPYGAYSKTDFRGWQGEIDHPGFRQLLRKLSAIVPPKVENKRPPFIADAGIPLPSIFLSVSSHDTRLSPAEAVKVLNLTRTPAILVSAYDLIVKREPRKLRQELETYKRNGGFVLVDSGNYEASRLNDSTWKPRHLKEALNETPHDWVFCFDELAPSKGTSKCIKEILDAVTRDQRCTTAPILPIIHTHKLKTGSYKLDSLPHIVRAVCEELRPPLVAIPERELGAGLIARAKMVRLIRNELRKLPFYQPIHLLGTGNPWSIVVLAAAGADTFDGLEWCRFSFDTGDREQISHFHHHDFFATQRTGSSMVRAAFGDDKVRYEGRVAIHNLDYFKSLIGTMHSAFSENCIEPFIMGVIGKSNFHVLKEQFPELFK